MSPSRRQRTSTRAAERPRRRATAALALCLAASAAAFALALAQRHASASRALGTTAAAPEKSRPFVPGEILVRFREESKAADADRALASLPSAALGVGGEIPVRLERARGLEIVRGLRLARVPAAETAPALAALRARPDVLYAEPNYVRRKFASPDDPRYPLQWSLRSNTQFGGPEGPDIDAEPAWDVTKGDRSVVVGVIDEGVDVGHEDLAPNVWTNPAETPGDGVDDDGNGYADDVHGWDFYHDDPTVYDGAAAYPSDPTDAHGTHVAGIVGAAGDNGLGVAGVNWRVSLLPLKILDDGAPAPSSVRLTVAAYAYAKRMRDLYVSTGGARGANVRVLNNSYGGPGRSQAEADAIRALGDSGVLFVAAAGNDGAYLEQSPAYPAGYDLPNVISVASTDRTDVLAADSNRGRTTVHMGAPGVDILSTTPGGTYATFSGTSMAAPHVAGAAALLLAKKPDASVERLRDALTLSGELTSFLGFNTVTGRRLNARLALDRLDSADATPPSAPTSLQASLGSREIRLNWVAPGDDGVSGRATLYEVRYSDKDLTVPENFASALKVGAPFPGEAFTPESLTFNAFYGAASVNVGVRAVDEAGNRGPVAQIHLVLDPLAVDPYAVRESAAEPLSVGGTPLGVVGDDEYKTVALPFGFPFYGFNTSSVRVSTNGTIYPVPNIYPPVTARDWCGAGDCFSSVDLLTANRVIAGAWDDLRTDRRVGDDVYVVTPDADRVVFRWQAVTYDTLLLGGSRRGEQPVNFEIELRRDGTIVTRYGDGNRNLFPVVGIADGARQPYVSASHTSEEAAKDLTSAGVVTFERRKPDTSPAADVRVTGLAADVSPAQTGKRLTYMIAVINYGSLEPAVTVTDALPPGTSFVSCSVPPFAQATCTGPAAGTSGAVTFNFPAMRSGLQQTMSVTVDVVAPGGTILTNTVTAASNVRDPDTSNNTRSVTTPVVGADVFANVKQVSARAYHTLALKADGTVWGWGDNKYGQLYDGTKDETRNLPEPVAGLSGVTSVAAGASFGLALKADGTVWGWGDNTWGQLGAADAPAATKNAPVQVRALSGVKSIAAGASHGVALKADGTLWAWGGNGGGQLGAGARDENPHFVPLFVASGVAAAAAGPGQTYFVKTDGTLWVCGYNFNGMAGLANTVSHVATPVKMEGLSDVAAVFASENSAFAVKADGTLWAWGDDTYGQLGRGARGAQHNAAPAQVSAVSSVVSVAAGYTYVYAATADGALWRWGTNSGTLAPSQAPNVSGVTQVVAGTQHAAALLSSAIVRAWGSNTFGQLGDGTNLTRDSWVEVSGLRRVATPVVTPDGGQFWPYVDVTVRCATPGAVMRYTVNSFQDPTESDPVIADGTTLRLTNDPSRVRVRAWKDGMPTSPVREAYFNIMSPGSFPPLPNPIDTPYAFVERHYKDFLGRDPDAPGQTFWTNDITSCGSDAPCVEAKRVNVSAAFFLSIEFQETGYFVYRLEKASFGRLPRFAQFMADSRQAAAGVVVNSAGWERKLEEGKAAFAELWARRADFKALYDAKTDAEYVDALYANAGVRPSQAERDSLVNGLGLQSETRATVLRKVADHAALRRAESNRAFVLMQYFGYLRRNPDDAPDADFSGYDFWLSKLDSFGGDYVAAEMVKAFITSDEYRRRFGRP